MGDEIDSKLERLKKRLNNRGKIVLKYKQLPDAIKGNIRAYNISITNITNASDDEITEYFRYLQNQERLRAGEIINSIPETALEKYLDRISERDILLRKFTFSNDRRQFDRVFYSILGLLDKHLGFGVMDRDILKFASETVELSDDGIKSANTIIEQLNHISGDASIPINYVNSNARSMKFLLLLCAYKLVDFQTDTAKKLKTLDSINKQLSSFSSAKAGSVEASFYGYTQDVIEEYRLIALISKGGHPSHRVYNRMQMLAYYVNDFTNKTVPSGIVAI